ncbi:MAG: TraR/DksA C4-type zinc finger protein [Patescibacteria group bacterium]|nr:TraR/DksA C4-type zinc finger protein [Patescibacteria group bacterium]
MIKDVKKIKEELVKRKEQLLKELKELSKKDSHEEDGSSAVFPEFGDKPDENAQEISEYSTIIATEKVLEKAINEIEETLKRIENKTYGLCKYCKKEIGEKRLLARPTASSCIDCKKKLQEENV